MSEATAEEPGQAARGREMQRTQDCARTQSTQVRGQICARTPEKQAPPMNASADGNGLEPLVFGTKFLGNVQDGGFYRPLNHSGVEAKLMALSTPPTPSAVMCVCACVCVCVCVCVRVCAYTTHSTLQHGPRPPQPPAYIWINVCMYMYIYTHTYLYPYMCM